MFKYHRQSAGLAHSRAVASVESKMVTMQLRLTFSSDTRGRPELLPLYRQRILLKLVIPKKNVLPRWRLNVETKTKRTLHSSRRLSFNELTNAKNLVLHSSHFALN